MMVKQVKCISWLRTDPPNCFPLCHVPWSPMTLSLNMKALTVAKATREQHFSSLNAATEAPLNTALTAGHTSSNICAQLSTPSRTPRTRAITPEKGTPCLQYKPEGVSISRRKQTKQDSRLHSCWSCACHIFYDSQLKSTPLPRQTVLLPGHWQAAGDGGSCHRCKDPLAFERKAGQSHETKRHSFLRTVHHTVHFSVSTPSCSHSHSLVCFNFPFQNLSPQTSSGFK